MAHSGPKASGSFVQTLVLTDIATGWTECAPLLVREQGLLVEVLTEMRELGGTAIELPKFRDAGGVWRTAITLPEEVHSPIAKAVLDKLVERGLAVRRSAR